jgi:sigma-B regulation protein RsbU (phosphoserine phosphatase)
MERILAVTRALAAPFDLHNLLETISSAARDMLHAERTTLWLHDPATDALVVEVSTDLPPLRVAVGSGIAGQCALTRQPINVSDCYADPRFNREVDRLTGLRTRCLLTLPVVDHLGALMGVMQFVNRVDGNFDDTDQALAEALAAQCGVALSRVRMTQSLVAGELLRQEMQLARAMQRSSLPLQLPELDGYQMHAVFQPASLTGGDTYDLALLPQGLLVVLGDAAGHGVAPALAVTQMQAMLRMALRLGATLETAFTQVNDQLAQTLPEGHFVNTFIGLLDPQQHVLRFISGGQGPILQFHADSGVCSVHRANSFPMGAMPIRALAPAVVLALKPGDWLVLLSDGVYESADPEGQPLGRVRVQALVNQSWQDSPSTLAQRLLDAVAAHGGGAAQDDDITMVLLRRLPT